MDEGNLKIRDIFCRICTVNEEKCATIEFPKHFCDDSESFVTETVFYIAYLQERVVILTTFIESHVL